MPNRDRDPLLKLVLDVVIGDGRFAFDDLAFWMFPAPNVDLPLNVLSIRADKHFELHVFVPFFVLMNWSSELKLGHYPEVSRFEITV